MSFGAATSRGGCDVSGTQDVQTCVGFVRGNEGWLGQKRSECPGVEGWGSGAFASLLPQPPQSSPGAGFVRGTLARSGSRCRFRNSGCQNFCWLRSGNPPGDERTALRDRSRSAEGERPSEELSRIVIQPKFGFTKQARDSRKPWRDGGPRGLHDQRSAFVIIVRGGGRVRRFGLSAVLRRRPAPRSAGSRLRRRR